MRNLHVAWTPGIYWYFVDFPRVVQPSSRHQTRSAGSSKTPCSDVVSRSLIVRIGFVHAIEAALSGGGLGTVIGVTVFDPAV